MDFWHITVSKLEVTQKAEGYCLAAGDVTDTVWFVYTLTSFRVPTQPICTFYPPKTINKNKQENTNMALVIKQQISAPSHTDLCL